MLLTESNINWFNVNTILMCILNWNSKTFAFWTKHLNTIVIGISNVNIVISINTESHWVEQFTSLVALLAETAYEASIHSVNFNPTVTAVRHQNVILVVDGEEIWRREVVLSPPS